MNDATNIPVTAISSWSKMNADEQSRILARPELDRGGLEKQVAEILAAVRIGGDEAVRTFSRRFDGVNLDALEVPAAMLRSAAEQVSPELLVAIDRAAGRIEAFHRASRPTETRMETSDGLECRSRYVPITPVGLYVPGGSAPLISTVMMLAIPASIAECPEVILCTPPGPDGNIDPAILAAADRCGVKRVFRIGGAQAIAAMAFGTETLPACAKLFGPGNAWVTEAKRQVSSLPGGAAQDLPAGPSEVLVIADDEADPEFVCWDLLSQAEHGPDSQALLLSDSDRLLAEVKDRLPNMAAGLPRADILRQSLASLRLVRVESPQQAIEVSNRYAPEHLIINCANADEMLGAVTAAGSVFLGALTPESLGDYSSGTNHVLPTYGYARAYSGLSVADFQRRMTVQRADFNGLAEAGADAMALAAAEGLDAHRMAVASRLDKGQD